MRKEGGIYIRDKAARRDMPARAPFGGTLTPFGARYAGSRNALPFGRPPVYKSNKADGKYNNKYILI